RKSKERYLLKKGQDYLSEEGESTWIRKKHFAKLRAEEQRRKPPTKTQKRNIMSTYLKNMAGYKHTQFKNKSFKEI
ncbi:hypothetical protein Tco_1249093, partial [Tanacetum coccineum]